MIPQTENERKTVDCLQKKLSLGSILGMSSFLVSFPGRHQWRVISHKLGGEENVREKERVTRKRGRVNHQCSSPFAFWLLTGLGSKSSRLVKEPERRMDSSPEFLWTFLHSLRFHSYGPFLLHSFLSILWGKKRKETRIILLLLCDQKQKKGGVAVTKKEVSSKDAGSQENDQTLATEPYEKVPANQVPMSCLR